MPFITKHQKLLTKTIAIIQILGGITGVGLIPSLLMHIETITGPNLLIVLIGFSLYIFSIYCGKILLFDVDKRAAVISSIINQALQVFQFGMFGYAFKFVSGLELSLGIQRWTLSFNISVIMSSFTMTINSDVEFYIKINFACIVVIYFLRKLYKISQLPVAENNIHGDSNDIIEAT